MTTANFIEKIEQAVRSEMRDGGGGWRMTPRGRFPMVRRYTICSVFKSPDGKTIFLKTPTGAKGSRLRAVSERTLVAENRSLNMLHRSALKPHASIIKNLLFEEMPPFYVALDYLQDYITLDKAFTFHLRTQESRIAATWHVGGKMVDVLSHLHDECRMVYLDFHPDNILIHPVTYHVMLIDFQSAKFENESKAVEIGIYKFRSPETIVLDHSEERAVRICQGDFEHLKAVDLWVLGQTMLLVLIGRCMYDMNVFLTLVKDVYSKDERYRRMVSSDQTLRELIDLGRVPIFQVEHQQYTESVRDVMAYFFIYQPFGNLVGRLSTDATRPLEYHPSEIRDAEYEAMFPDCPKVRALLREYYALIHDFEVAYFKDCSSFFFYHLLNYDPSVRRMPKKVPPMVEDAAGPPSFLTVS